MRASALVDLGSLAPAECIKLVTFRRSGAEVATPVWFVVDAGKVFLRTLAHFGKVRRLRHNPAVKFAACDWGGTLCGPWLQGRAELLVPGDARIEAVDAMLDHKYGEQRAEMNRMVQAQGLEPVFVAITPGPPGGEAAQAGAPVDTLARYGKDGRPGDKPFAKMEP